MPFLVPWKLDIPRVEEGICWGMAAELLAGTLCQVSELAAEEGCLQEYRMNTQAAGSGPTVGLRALGWEVPGDWGGEFEPGQCGV